MMGHHAPYRGGIEQDVFSGWRKLLKSNDRAGVCRYREEPIQPADAAAGTGRDPI